MTSRPLGLRLRGGIENAFRYFADLAVQALTRDLTEWIATPTWQAAAEHLTTHADRPRTADAEMALEASSSSVPIS
jgi:hypothetical protein